VSADPPGWTSAMKDRLRRMSERGADPNVLPDVPEAKRRDAPLVPALVLNPSPRVASCARFKVRCSRH
jgi:hypothetical protein